MRDIPSVSGRMGKGLQWEAAAVEAGVLPAAVRYCTAAPTQAPWTRRHPGCPAPSGQRRLWQRREPEYYVLHTRYRIPGLQQGKLRQLWVSHFNHQALLSCLPPPLLAQVWSCQASFIPGYLLYPWGILKICGLPPALLASPLSHGCLFCLNITKQRRHEEKQIYSRLPWKPAQRVNNRREGQVPMDPEDLLGSNCCDISVLHNPRRQSCPRPEKKGKRGKLTAWFLRCCFLEPFPGFSDLYGLACSCLCFSFISPQEVGSGPGLWKNPASARTRRFYLQETQCYPMGGESSVCCSPGSVQRAQHFSSPTPGRDWAIWGLASAANVGTGMQTEPGLLQVGLRARSLKTGRLTGNKFVCQLCSLPAKHPWACSWDLALSPFPLGPAQRHKAQLAELNPLHDHLNRLGVCFESISLHSVPCRAGTN